MIANFIYRFSTSPAVFDRAVLRKRRIAPTARVGVETGLAQHLPTRRPPLEPSGKPPQSEAQRQAEIDALEDPERWDGLA
jgi:hypothetical protein